ncbi:uncharacterized protein LOC110002072 [Xyrichtys novacula]|uniref:Uncharacterized protein LOC110002072 n=1 Tax=Xyrichtys novacula TaxID=13765 RepID=A0AAV1HDR6_XYRNO|nr:uncharacterized protein LOC110002072 [Xyrichtys novacula]
MKLWVSCLVLVLGSCLSSSAMSPEECQPLVTPLSLADPSPMFGKMHFLMGFVENEVFNAILKVTDSSWVNISQSSASPNELLMTEGNKLNGTCISSKFTMTLEEDMAKIKTANLSCTFYSLPSCEGCLALNMNSSVVGLKDLLDMMKIESPTEADEVHTHAFYLLARNTTVDASDLEHFKKQAECLGFKGEPNYQFDPKNDFCEEGEGIFVAY